MRASKIQLCFRVLIAIGSASVVLGFSGCAALPANLFSMQQEAVVWGNAAGVGFEETPGPALTSGRVRTETEIEPVKIESELFPQTSAVADVGSGEGVEPAAIVASSYWPNEIGQPKIQSTWQLLVNDQKEFYLSSSVRPAVLSLGASAILSNTSIDQEFADWYQDDVRSESLDDVAKVAKAFGEQWPMMSAYAAASLTGRLLDKDSRLAAWGDQSTRSMLVGVPPLLFLQKAIGSSRPNDTPPTSKWNFWNDENGASGHTFVGAVPFLVAAQLTDDPRWKTTWTVLSTFTGWSRINDNDHYLSQVIVGWWLAYAATRSVDRSDLGPFEVRPLLQDGGLGLGVDWNY